MGVIIEMLGGKKTHELFGAFEAHGSSLKWAQALVVEAMLETKHIKKIERM